MAKVELFCFYFLLRGKISLRFDMHHCVQKGWIGSIWALICQTDSISNQISFYLD